MASLPFKLTGAQRLAAWEIFQNMEKNTPMNRLLQGDVGSGKTMVAALAAYEVILQGRQVALLAPTGHPTLRGIKQDFRKIWRKNHATHWGNQEKGRAQKTNFQRRDRFCNRYARTSQ